jgi:hypothetical protein
MQLALLDLPTSLDRALPLSFSRPCSLDPVDVLIWQPAAIDGVYAVEGLHLGRPVLGVADSQRLVKDSRFWRDALRAFIGRGGTLVMLAPGRATLGIHTVQDVVGYDLIEALPEHTGLGRKARAPAAVACTAGEPFRSFFDAAGARFVACAEFDAANAQAIAHVAGAAAVCALYQYRHPGRLLVLPSLAPGLPTAAVDDIAGSIADVVARLRFEGPILSPQSAKAAFEMPGEAALRRQLADVAARQRALQAEHDLLAHRLSDLAFLRQLHGGDAAGALEACALVLHALGAYTQQGAPGTHTLMFEIDGRTGVLVAIDDAQRALGDGLAEHVRSRAQAWSAELNSAIVPLAIHVGGDQGSGPQRLPQPMPGFFVTGRDLQQAYDTRDTAAPGQWLDAAEAARAR